MISSIIQRIHETRREAILRRKLLIDLNALLQKDIRHSVMLWMNRAVIRNRNKVALLDIETLVRERIAHSTSRGKFTAYSTKTLELLHATYASKYGLENLMQRLPNEYDTNVFLREFLTYKINSESEDTDAHTVYRECRKALSVVDMSKAPEEYRRGVEAVLTSAFQTAERQLQPWEYEGDDAVMTHGLAHVLMKYPERTEDISNYMTSRHKAPSAVDAKNLTDYLNLPCKALNEGFL